MAQLSILEYPDPRLRILAKPVADFDDTLGGLVDNMIETLRATGAIGLAAPQLGIPLQIIVVDVSGDRSNPEVFINPSIESRGRIAEVDEGCLSLPGLQVRVRRATRLRLRARDRHGIEGVRDVEDLLAVCVQHEMDHLRGRLLVDHLSLFQRIRLRLRPGPGTGRLQSPLATHN